MRTDSKLNIMISEKSFEWNFFDWFFRVELPNTASRTLNICLPLSFDDSTIQMGNAFRLKPIFPRTLSSIVGRLIVHQTKKRKLFNIDWWETIVACNELMQLLRASQQLRIRILRPFHDAVNLLEARVFDTKNVTHYFKNDTDMSICVHFGAMKR